MAESLKASAPRSIPVTFDDLTYGVPKKDAPDGILPILHGISGCFQPGRMAALMGPSGSGKTTLLDLLAGRKTAGSTGGSVLMAGCKPTENDLKEICGYVEQFDTLVGELTVGQMMAYTAELKLPAGTTQAERNARCEEVIEKLNLGPCRDTVIGTALQRGISGGQAKRVNIGLSLITRPAVLFLDEPTSGLDSHTANEVVLLLKQLAAEGRTVVCTIHSPTGLAFQQFDDLLMLREGRTIFEGPLSTARAYFEAMGHSANPNCSFPEWLVDLTSGRGSHFELQPTAPAADLEGGGSDSSKPSADTDFAAAFEASSAKAAADAVRVQASANAAGGVTLGSSQYRKPGALSNLATLLKYRMTAHYKDGQFMGTRFGDKIMFSVLILSLYWKIGEGHDPQSIQSTATLLYFISALCGYGAAAFVPSLTLERALFYRELADGCYSPITYYGAKFIEEGLLATITSLLFSVVVFFGCGMQGSFAIFAFAYYLTTMMGIVLAYGVAALVPTMEAANAILPTYVTTCMYFGGLFIVFDKIPSGWEWFSWTSFLRYSWGALMLNQFQDSSQGRAAVFMGQDDSSIQPITVLDFYGFDNGVMKDLWGCIGLLCLLLGFWSFIGCLALTFIRHENR